MEQPPASAPDDASPAPRDVSRWRIGEVELDESSLELRRRGEPVTIERKPLELLMWLLRHPGEVVTKDELLDALWAGRVVTESVLTKCVAKLRAALADDSQAILKTVHGFGYRLVAPVERLDLALAGPAPPAPALNPGDAPPLRPNWQLVERYEGARGETWLGRHRKTGESRVFKFALDAAALVQLRREVTLHRLLRDTLGPREDIVRVLDWNLDEMPCFVEFEHCDGGDFGRWLAARGGAVAVPLATRLAIVEQAATALAAAHSAGVLHKDVKPSNVLLQSTPDGGFRVRLADFGSGRVLDADRLQALEITRMGLTGTPDSGTSGTWAWLAPEVAAGQPATALSDLYALGVMLYQAVVGDLRRPLAPGWERDVDDPLLREDIAACCDREPSRRLGDAAELARRLQTVEARRAEAAARRRDAERVAALTAALAQARQRRRWISRLALVALAGLAVSVVLLVQWRAARDVARDAAHRAEHEAAVAAAVTRFLQEDVLGAASPYRVNRDGFHPAPNRLLTVREAIDRAAAQVESRFAASPRVAAAVHANLGRVYADLRELGAARVALQRAAALYRREAADDRALVDVLLDLSAVHWDNGQASASLPHAAEALQRARRLEPPLPLLEIEAGGELAWVRYHNGEADAAVDELQRWYDAALALGPDAAEVADQLRYRLGRTALEGGRYPQAVALMREHLAWRTARHGEQHLDTAFAMRELGSALAWSGQFEEARALFERTLSLVRPVFAADDKEVLDTVNELATAHYQAGDHATAERLWVELAQAGQRRYGASESLVVTALGNAASANRRLGRYERALAFAQQAADAEARAPNVPPSDALITRFKLAEALLLVERAAQALPLFEAIEREAAGAIALTSFWHGDFALRRGEALARLGREAEAAEAMQRALDRYAAAEGVDAQRVQEARRQLASLSR